MSTENLNQLPAQAIVLAAGKGKRMNSPLPKVLHLLGGAPLILHVLASAVTAGVRSITSVLGHGKNEVEKTIRDWAKGVRGVDFYFAYQEEQLGTGHAVMVAESLCKGRYPYILVLLGDVPLLKSTTLNSAVRLATETSYDAIVLTTFLDNPTGYGRIIRNSEGEVIAIREERDASEEEKKISEVNTGIFIFRDEALWPYLTQLKNENAQGEYYLTDMVEELLKHGKKVGSYVSQNSVEFFGVNSPEQLAELEKLFVSKKS